MSISEHLHQEDQEFADALHKRVDASLERATGTSASCAMAMALIAASLLILVMVAAHLIGG